MKVKNYYNKLVNRDAIYSYYYNKYYDLYMNNYIIDNIDYEQKNYILRKLWADGTVAVFKLKNAMDDKHPQGLLVFTPYAVNGFNIYDFPTDVILVNTRGVRFIPSKPLKVNKDVVLGYARRCQKPIHQVVDLYCNKIANVEMVIQINLLANKAPWILGTSPENEKKMQEFWYSLLSDEPRLYASLEDADKAHALVSGAPYVIDKLQAYKCDLENELREFFGFNNLGVAEKKEHLITDEVESNNEAVGKSKEVFFNCLEEFSDRIKEVLDYDMPVKINEVDDVGYNAPDEAEEEDVEDEN